MAKIGEILSQIMSDTFFNKAAEFSKLFLAWEKYTKSNGIAAAIDHSKIVDLKSTSSNVKNNLLIVEADHPGWIQILQTKESKLLSDIQKEFSNLNISGIVFKLSNMPLGIMPLNAEERKENIFSTEKKLPYNNLNKKKQTAKNQSKNDLEESKIILERIKDEKLREKLKSLGEDV
jgi:hypothetical protein